LISPNCSHSTASLRDRANAVSVDLDTTSRSATLGAKVSASSSSSASETESAVASASDTPAATETIGPDAKYADLDGVLAPPDLAHRMPLAISIGDNAVVERSVVHDNTYLGSGVRVEGSVLGRGSGLGGERDHIGLRFMDDVPSIQRVRLYRHR